MYNCNDDVEPPRSSVDYCKSSTPSTSIWWNTSLPRWGTSSLTPRSIFKLRMLLEFLPTTLHKKRGEVKEHDSYPFSGSLLKDGGSPNGR